MELLSLLAESGKKIFNTDEAKEFAPSVGIPTEYVSKVLHLLKEGGWIISLRHGLFALSKGFSTEPLHEFEIAMALAKPVAISHWSALHYHGLSDQIPRKIFLLASQEATIPRQRSSPFGIYTVQGISFVFSRIKTELFFGITQIWVNRSTISITDPERTLLDGLDKPQLCGGFNEVLHAFQVLKQRIDLEKIISYALQWDSAIVKRLGWVLSYIGFEKKQLIKLQKVKVKGYRRLDCSLPAKGRCNSTWMIQENIYG
jgi:predicted transcriptional regulator of viral defense system